MLTRRERPTLRRNHQRPRVQDRGLSCRQQMARADRARAGRLAGDDAVLRRHARRSRSTPEHLADPQLRPHSASGIVAPMRHTTVSAALLLTLVLGIRSVAAQASSASSPAATQSAATPAAELPRVRLLATGGTISNRVGG